MLFFMFACGKWNSNAVILEFFINHHFCCSFRMQRNKGQFTSAKSNNEDSASAISSWGSNQSWAGDVNGSQNQDIV